MKTRAIETNTQREAQTRATTDAMLIERWVHGRSKHTQRAYRSDARRLLDFGGSLRSLTLDDLQAFADSLQREGLSPASRARILSAAKSLLAFGHRVGYLRFDVGAALRLPEGRVTVSERILSESDVQRLMALSSGRDRIVVRLFYATGLRVSEIVSLRWRDVQPREGTHAGQITVFGKGSKTRAVLVPRSVWAELIELRGERGDDEPVFRSRVGARALSSSQLRRVVRARAKGAGIKGAVSPHWLRHAHATHALERGAPIHLVQATLGHASVATTGRYLHARPTASSSEYLAL